MTRLARRRVLVPSAAPGDRVRLDAAQAHHLLQVLRARPGDAVTAVDAAGRSYRAVVLEASGELRIEVPISEPMPPGPALLVAPPKGTRMAWLVEKAVELGAGAVLPVATAHGAVRPGGEAQVARWRRVAEAAVKQSGAAPPEVRPMAPLAEALSGLAGPLWVAHPAPEALPLHRALEGSPAVPAFAVGPEGGWTGAELALLAGAGGRCVTLGPRILRIETAALACLLAWDLRTNRQC